MRRPIITLTTDFGLSDHFVGTMKGVILGICPQAEIIDISNEIPPFETHEAAFALAQSYSFFPPKTVHVVVVDPGVGTDRAIVFARIGRQAYVVPDNGLLSRLARRTPPAKIVRLTEPEYWLHPVSAVFHGRDVMAPVAARLSLGLEPDHLGVPQDRLAMLDWPEVRVLPGRIEGSVLLVDGFGNLVTDVTAAMLADAGKGRESAGARIWCRSHSVHGLCRTYGDRPTGSPIALIGSSDRLELAVVGGNAAATLGAGAGDAVTVRWE